MQNFRTLRQFLKIPPCPPKYVIVQLNLPRQKRQWIAEDRGSIGKIYKVCRKMGKCNWIYFRMSPYRRSQPKLSRIFKAKHSSEFSVIQIAWTYPASVWSNPPPGCSPVCRSSYTHQGKSGTIRTRSLFKTNPRKLSDVQAINIESSDHKLIFATRYSRNITRNQRIIKKLYLSAAFWFCRYRHLGKLELYGFHAHVVSWFRSYLINRHQRVYVDGVRSDPK